MEFSHRVLREYTPETASTAVHLALESAARKLDKRPDARNVDPRPVIEETIRRLVRAGIVVPPKAQTPVSEPPAGTNTGPPAALVHKAMGHRPDHTDELMIRAFSYPYRFTDRPGRRGLPLLSAAFHPSSLARIGDPQHFDGDTAAELLAHRKRHYDARAILHFALGARP